MALRPILSCVLLTLLPTTLAATVVEVDGAPVTEATVYLSGAELVREITAQVPRGASTVEILGFPDGVEADAVRASVSGGPVSVVSFAVDRRTTKPDGDTAAIDARIAELEDRLFAIDKRESDEQALRAFLEEAVATRLRPGTEADPAERLEPDAIVVVYELMSERFEAMLADRLERRRQRRSLEAEVKEAKRAKLDALRPLTVRVAQVGLHAEQAAAVTVRLRHFVDQAAWAPRYRAILRDSTVELIAEAAVRQWTAEPWSSAHLRLTTIDPSKSLDAPYLGEWQLAVREPVTEAPGDAFAAADVPRAQRPDGIRTGGNESGIQSVFVSPGISYAEPTQGKASAAAVPPEEQRSRPEATRTRYSVTFEAPGRAAVPGGGQPRQIELWRERLPAIVTYRAKPALERAAYLEAMLTTPDAFPILPGVMKLFSGEALLGERNQPELAPGSDLILSLGVDNRIEVARAIRDPSRHEIGWRSRDVQASYAVHTRITNRQDGPIRIAVEDRMPVAADGRVVVALDPATTAGHQPSKTRDGVLICKLELAPGESAEIDFGFSVRYPGALQVSGL